jgi:uncharacterized protein (TIGR02594 family)
MPGRPQVSIRLGTTGRGDVERDFAAIGDSGEAQARRYQSAWERASAEAERALDKQAKAAARLAAVVPNTPVQQSINVATGVGSVQTGNAKAAAAALAAELDHAEAEARQLIAAIDPLFAAQSRYEAQIERIHAVRATGQLDEQRYQQLLAHEKALLDEATAAGNRNTVSRGQQRLGAQQLGFQMNDVASQMAMGTRASVIFAQQSAQTVQALQLMGGEGNKFLEFLRGPWGIALSVAVVALSPLIGKMLEAGDVVDGLVDKLKKEAQQQVDNDRAHHAFAATLEGVNAALRDNQKLLDQQGEKQESAAHKALAAALAAKAHAEALQVENKALLDNARANYEVLKAQASGPGQRGELAALGLEQSLGNLQALQTNLAQTSADIKTAEGQIADATSRVYVEAVMRDPADRIKRQYDSLIESTRQRLVGEKATTAEIAKQTEALKLQRDAAIKDARDRDKPPPRNAGGTAIFDSQISAYFDTAAKYRGMSETGNKGVLEAFFREANQQLDPQKTAWCAAFVNAVLAANGAKGTGSLAASSFLNFGKDDTRSPQRGDIVVVKSSASPSGQHVGFLDTIDAKGNVRVLGGNTGNKVGTLAAGAKDVLAIRRPPTPAEAATASEKAAAASDKAAAAALQAQDTFDTERARLNDQLLAALGKVALGYEAQSVVQEHRAQADHDNEAQAIATNLAQGKYGDATSKLAQTRAQQLNQANDDLLKERQAAIALESYVKSLQSQDAAAEREAKYKTDALEYQQSIAKTSVDRRKLGQEIIDIEYREKEQHLKYLLALDQLLGNTEDAAKVAAELAHLPEQKKRDQDKNDRDNQGPLKDYYDSIPSNLHEAGDIIQNDLVDAFKQMNAGLTDALMKSKNFHDLWKNMKSVAHDFATTLLKDLIDLTIKMFIIKPLLNMITGGTGTIGGFATGTEYAPGGAAWVGEHGPELVNMPRGAKVFTAAESRRMAANDGGGLSIGTISIVGDFRGADPGAVAGINARLDQMQERLPSQIIETWQDARARHLLRV